MFCEKLLIAFISFWVIKGFSFQEEPVTIDVNVENVFNHGVAAYLKLAESSEFIYDLAFFGVVSAKVQNVDDGKLFYLELEVGNTKCLKTGEKPQGCLYDISGKQICQAQVKVLSPAITAEVVYAACGNDSS